MPKSGVPTREKILDIAESLVLSHGFAGASIDKVIGKAGITKGTFFYHFKNKRELAKILIERFHDKDMDQFRRFMKRAETLSEDPLQQLIIFVGLLEDMLDSLEEPFPGCLFASYAYQSEQFDDEIMCVCSSAMVDWRTLFGDKIKKAIEIHQPGQEVDADSLADLLTCILEGALLISKTLDDVKIAAPQLAHYRKYLECLFKK
ncbi:MAG: TetR family transcriptional regulator [Nitrospinaceae bacterium]|nr:TetR/AcrR family transcriptional regulator [Nitrospinaceae bacterium]NIR57497.1 TetR/AcrR family transcriptional regulator [Nitrospinaceae bacterium]NIS87967.1 TetR/AcrR family transcriptional regulator [Nitrospinaceae bacterium]NIT84832.1 TetR/AcrR family transcriptional regulator [Nitrospinaceae bacterium]NIU47012.1 TetR/AcrR family transcriptional regulator [Nitrospinaceae bacterium]